MSIKNKDDYILVIAGKKQDGVPEIEKKLGPTSYFEWVGPTSRDRKRLTDNEEVTTFVDSVNGVDELPGGTIDQPFKTYNYAVENFGPDNDYMGCMDGTYETNQIPIRTVAWESQGNVVFNAGFNSKFTIQPVTLDIKAIATDGNIYIAVGRRIETNINSVVDSSILYYSFDRKKWFPILGQLRNETLIRNVHYGNGVFILTAGEDGQLPKVYRSIDGLSWTNIILPDIGPSAEKFNSIANGTVSTDTVDTWVIAGDNTTNTKAYSSRNGGLTWTANSVLGAGSLSGNPVTSLLFYIPSLKFVAGGQTGAQNTSFRFSDIPELGVWIDSVVVSTNNPPVTNFAYSKGSLIAFSYIKGTPTNIMWSENDAEDWLELPKLVTGQIVINGKENKYFMLDERTQWQRGSDVSAPNYIDWVTDTYPNFGIDAGNVAIYDEVNQLILYSANGGIVTDEQDVRQMMISTDIGGIEINADNVFARCKILNCHIKTNIFQYQNNYNPGFTITDVYIYNSIIDSIDGELSILRGPIESDNVSNTIIDFWASVFIIRNSQYAMKTICRNTLNTKDLKFYTSEIIGSLEIYNTVNTEIPLFRDMVITKNVSASKTFNIPNGCIAGEINNITFDEIVFRITPIFRNNTEYILMDSLAGDPFTNVILEQSIFYTLPSGQKRDLGAWSFDREHVEFYYSKPHWLSRPRDENRLRHEIDPLDFSLSIGDNGEPTSYNNPERTIERLKINLNSVEEDDLEFLEFLYSLNDLEALVSFDVKSIIKLPTITANGAHSSGDVVININSSIHVSGGTKVTISEINYYVLYPLPNSGNTNKIILSRPLENNIPNSEPIVSSFPKGMGIYQIVLSKNDYFYPIKVNNKIINKINLGFVRKHI